jgi:hypothetical protein
VSRRKFEEGNLGYYQRHQVARNAGSSRVSTSSRCSSDGTTKWEAAVRDAERYEELRREYFLKEGLSKYLVNE